MLGPCDLIAEGRNVVRKLLDPGIGRPWRIEPLLERLDLRDERRVIVRFGGRSLADVCELVPKRGEILEELLDSGIRVGGNGVRCQLLTCPLEGARQLVRRDDLGRKPALEVVELLGERGFLFAVPDELLHPHRELVDLPLHRRIGEGLGRDAHLGEPGPHLREVLGDAVDAGIGQGRRGG